MPRKPKDPAAVARGSVRSPAKAAAARRNGAVGGRPSSSAMLRVQCASPSQAARFRDEAAERGMSLSEFMVLAAQMLVAKTRDV